MAAPPPPRRAERFCWRERCERINWRLLRALDLSDVLRRGDPALLEPYALHVTFARLPSVSQRDARDRDAWFLVRLLQLSMEFLLFMRSRDGDVVDSLFQQLQQCERERDDMAARAQKWKGKAESSERQVEKLHQVLQNIAKLLQVHGASSSAVATIQTLLTELVVERRARRQGKKQQPNQHDEEKEGDNEDLSLEPPSVCGYCGKLFSSKHFLRKHISRRHTDSRRPETEELSQLKTKDIQDGRTVEQSAAFQKVMEQFEQMFVTHEENFRMLSAQEIDRVQRLYEQFHVEIHSPERPQEVQSTLDFKLREQQDELEVIIHQKEESAAILEKMKEDIAILTQRRVALENAVNAPPPRNETLDLSSNSDCLASSRSEVIRLQASLEEVSQMLEDTRTKLARLQTDHLSAIREKQMLIDRLDQARDKIDALEEAAAASTVDHAESYPLKVEVLAPAPVAIAKTDVTTQTDAIESTSAGIQTMEKSVFMQTAQTLPQKQTYRDVSIQTIPAEDSPLSQNELVEIGIQTTSDLEDDTKEPMKSMSDLTHSPDTRLDSGSPHGIDEELESPLAVDFNGSNTEVPEFVQIVSCEELADAVFRRSERAAATSTIKDYDTTKTYAPIARRKFLRSQFPHNEPEVKAQIKSCFEKLDKLSDRFGVSSRNGSQLSNKHFDHVRQALHAHLEILPTEVLARMIECETQVNQLIKTEWVPREVTRKEALDKLKIESNNKSLRNQELVKQAMSIFGMTRQQTTDDNRESASGDVSINVQSQAEYMPTSITASTPTIILAQCQLEGRMEDIQGSPQVLGDQFQVEFAPKSIVNDGDTTRNSPQAFKVQQHEDDLEVKANISVYLPELQGTIQSPHDRESLSSVAEAEHYEANVVSQDEAAMMEASGDNDISLQETVDSKVCESIDSSLETGVRDEGRDQEQPDTSLNNEKEHNSPSLKTHRTGDHEDILMGPHYHNISQPTSPVSEEKSEKVVDSTDFLPSRSLHDSIVQNSSPEGYELSASAVLSSELSFAESIPSILSDDHRTEGISFTKSSVESITTLQTWGNDEVAEESADQTSFVNEDWEHIKSDEAYPTVPHGHHGNIKTGDKKDSTTTESSPTATTTRPAVCPVAHDDDDIEEIELS